MILDLADLRTFRGKVTLVDGGFDPLHEGHIRYFREARRLGLPLLCSIACDRYVRSKHAPLLSHDQRLEVIDALRDISYTVVNTTTTAEVLEELRPRYYAKGKDWENRLPVEEVEVCARHGIEILYLDTVCSSSTALLKNFQTHTDFRGEVASFEMLVHEQKPWSSDHYDESYFMNEWRPDGNCYTLEARRKIEGRNPELIKEVFNPNRVLDLGCGPGALMYLLHELGIDVAGVDFSESCKLCAPPVLKDRITVSNISETALAPASFDLVICREVLEHLTVLQVRKAVREMCRLSSRYIYVTTRYHPDPQSLLSVTTQFDVDPTHITLMNKEFLRALFVLEGFRSRPDLEQRMDWLNKGRVLAFERVATEE